jgi:hypothetical protein
MRLTKFQSVNKIREAVSGVLQSLSSHIVTLSLIWLRSLLHFNAIYGVMPQNFFNSTSSSVSLESFSLLHSTILICMANRRKWNSEHDIL